MTDSNEQASCCLGRELGLGNWLTDKACYLYCVRAIRAPGLGERVADIFYIWLFAMAGVNPFVLAIALAHAMNWRHRNQ